MSPAAASLRPASRTRWTWSLLPLMLLCAAALLANMGANVTGSAKAATSNVTVNATVASNVTLTPCGSPLNIAVTMGGFVSGTCSVTFGASNNAALPLQINDSDATAPFLSGAFTNTAVACDAAMTGDTVGVKVASGGTATNNTCATPTVATSNLDYQAMPLTATTVCTTTVTGTQTCPIAIGIVETGSDATAGTYSGIMTLTA